MGISGGLGTRHIRPLDQEVLNVTPRINYQAYWKVTRNKGMWKVEYEVEALWLFKLHKRKV